MINKNPFNIGEEVFCKCNYEYNGRFLKGDKFIIIGYNEYNIRLKTKNNTFHNIKYSDKNVNELYYFDLFYIKLELRNLKLKEILS